MKIFVDADGCPVTRLTADIAREYGVECIIICDTSHSIEIEFVRTVTVDKGADSADYKIANMISDGDIAVTQDYGLAAMCLGKKAKALNQNGLVYSEKNIDSLLFSRHVAKKVRNGGGRLKGPKKRSEEDDNRFELALRKLINPI